MIDEIKELAKSLLLALFAIFCVTAIVVNKATPFALAVMACAKAFYPGYPYGWAATLFVPAGAWAASFLALSAIKFFMEEH